MNEKQKEKVDLALITMMAWDIVFIDGHGLPCWFRDRRKQERFISTRRGMLPLFCTAPVNAMLEKKHIQHGDIERKVLTGTDLGAGASFEVKTNGAVIDLRIPTACLYEWPTAVWAKISLRRLIINEAGTEMRVKASVRSRLNLKDYGTPLCALINDVRKVNQ